MRVLIVDDECAARRELAFILQEIDARIEITEAMSGVDALEAVAQQRPEVIFLDVQMPEMDGLEAARRLLEHPSPPLVVFATAYDRYAVEAFELAAVDYVVKPFDEARVELTLSRIRHILAEREQLEAQTLALRGFLRSRDEAGGKLWGERPNGSKVPVDYREIRWLVAEQKKVFAHTSREKLRVHSTLKELEDLLKAHGFVRIHKAYLVNLDHIAEVAPWFSGGYRVEIKGMPETHLVMSRRYARKVKSLKGW